MAKSITQIRLEVAARHNDWRAINRIIHSREFEDVFNSDPNVIQMIEQGDREGILRWVRNQNRESLTVSELRKLARDYGIPGWYNYSKPSLLMELSRVTAATAN
jgi:hypothetical protein